MVKVSRVELVKCNLDHEWELDLVRQECMKKVQDSKAQIEELINVVGVNCQYQGLSLVVGTDGGVNTWGGGEEA